METKIIIYQQSKISYTITGKGNPVVLLHGFGEDGNVWQYQTGFLKEHFLLIIPDLPGSGKSEMLTKKTAIQIEDYAETIKAILDEEKITNCKIMGHSMGGYITLAFVNKYPNIITSFGLIHSTAFADSEEKKLIRLKAIEFLKNNGPYEFLKTSIPGLFGSEWMKNNYQKINVLIEEGKNFIAEALIQYYHAMITRIDRTDILRNFSKPILFIIGEHDMAIPFQQSLQQCYIPSQSHVHILRNSGHMGMWEEPEKLNPFLLQFLQLSL